MTLYEFLSLDETGQGNAVWNGVHLTARVENGMTIILYDLGGFYVEVFYDAENNRIVRLKPFRKTSALAPYLNEIGIKDLL